MATGRNVNRGPGTSGLVQFAGGVATAPARGVPEAPANGDAPAAFELPPITVTEAARRERETWDSSVIAQGDLGTNEWVRLEFRQEIERVRIVQRTANAVLALGYGRTPSSTDYDDLVVGAIYFDFPVPRTREVTILNIGGVALADDLLIIGMYGPRFRMM